MSTTENQSATIRVGVGGWTFEPWRDNFYPAGWSHARELEYASQRLSAIEVNGVWIMSRTPTMPEAEYADLVARLNAAGYDNEKLIRIPQRWP